MALRKSTGLRNKLLGLSVNMLTNSTFDTNTTGWSENSATLSIESGGKSNSALKVANSGAGKGYAYQTFSTKTGREYKVNAFLKKGTANANISIFDSNNNILYSQTVSETDWTEVRFTFSAVTSSTSIRLTVDSTSSGDYALFDEVYIYDIASSIKEIFRNGKIEIRSGTQPSSADSAPSGTLLMTILSDGNGLVFNDASSGSIGKPSGANWSGTAVASGTAGWFRLCHRDDSGSSSTTEERIDGAIAVSGGELNMSSTNIVSGSMHIISSFNLSISA